MICAARQHAQANRIDFAALDCRRSWPISNVEFTIARVAGPSPRSRRSTSSSARLSASVSLGTRPSSSGLSSVCRTLAQTVATSMCHGRCTLAEDETDPQLVCQAAILACRHRLPGINQVARWFATRRPRTRRTPTAQQRTRRRHLSVHLGDECRAKTVRWIKSAGDILAFVRRFRRRAHNQDRASI